MATPHLFLSVSGSNSEKWTHMGPYVVQAQRCLWNGLVWFSPKKDENPQTPQTNVIYLNHFYNSTCQKWKVNYLHVIHGVQSSCVVVSSFINVFHDSDAAIYLFIYMKDIHCWKFLERNKEHIDNYDGIFSAETLQIFSTIHKSF